MLQGLGLRTNGLQPAQLCQMLAPLGLQISKEAAGELLEDGNVQQVHMMRGLSSIDHVVM